MRSTLLQKIRWGVIRTQEIPLLGTLYRKTSQAVTWQIGRKLAKMPGVEAVFIRHNPPTSPSFVVGHSDLDLTLVFNDEDAENPGRIRACSMEMERLSHLYPLIQTQDARLMSQGELTQLPGNFSPLFELLYKPDDWLLIGGREVRNGVSHSFPLHRIPWHPEFNRWWEHLIQHYSFSDKSDLEKGFMRTIFRCALKNQLALQAAKGMPVKLDTSIDDEPSTVEFGGNQELKNTLIDLRKQNFWEKHPEEMKMRILFLVLLAVGDFFDKWRMHPLVQKELKIHSRSAEEPHCSIYRELEGRIKSHPEIQLVLKAAVAYPLPHSYPYSYKVDLVLRDGLSLGEFTKGMRIIEQCFGAKEFTVGKYHAEITLTLENIYTHPLFFLGSPCPFLLEHIQEFGTTVYGSPITTIQGALSHNDLTDWCRIYLPYHMFTLRRRPGYRGRTMNFYQLASIRIFLEYGDRLTDALQIRKMYLERLGNSDRDASILDYFLHGTLDRLDKVMYHDSFVFLSNEYNQLQSLLT